MSSKEQISVLKSEMEKEIMILKSLPEDKAKKRAQEALVGIGIINDSGTVRKQYSKAFVRE